jgi:actin-like ATPase involved in cell morphogenesis
MAKFLIWNMAKKIGIDLGTTNTVVFIPKKE